MFTPQIVIDGQASFVGSDRNAIIKAIRISRQGVPISISQRGDSLTIDLESTAAQRPADVLLVAYQGQALTPIGRGENAGRTLREFNIVRAAYALASWDGKPRIFLVSRASLPSEASRIAVLLQETGQRAIVGAASFALR